MLSDCDHSVDLGRSVWNGSGGHLEAKDSGGCVEQVCSYIGHNSGIEFFNLEKRSREGACECRDGRESWGVVGWRRIGGKIAEC
jgi:hypothetical protein